MLVGSRARARPIANTDPREIVETTADKVRAYEPNRRGTCYSMMCEVADDPGAAERVTSRAMERKRSSQEAKVSLGLY
jgi:hypothetical protein